MKLYLARHGRTNYNDLNLCNADPAVDVHLTPTGIEQIEALAGKLTSTPFDCIFISELKRTQQTAEIINKFHSANIEIDPRLNDIYSSFEGKPFEEFVDALEAADNKWTARFNEGESIEDMKKRVLEFIDELRTKQYDAVLIITSEWIIRAMYAIVDGLTNEEAWRMEVEQGGYREVEV